MPLVALLLALTGPIVARVLLTLGVGIVTITGLTALLGGIVANIQASFNGLPTDIMQLVFLSGVPQGMAIILSALAARLTMMSMSKIQRL